MSDALGYVDSNLARFRSELYDFLRIPSVSAKSEHNDDTRHAAAWFRDKLEAAGLASEVMDTPGHPIVVGEIRDAGPDAPTVVVEFGDIGGEPTVGREDLANLIMNHV